MKSFTKHTGLVAAMDRVNVDTDQIIPKQFLKRVERSGFGQFLFNDWRFLDNGEPNPEFELNQSRFEGATILPGANQLRLRLFARACALGAARLWVLLDYRAVVRGHLFTTTASRTGCFRFACPSRKSRSCLMSARLIPITD